MFMYVQSCKQRDGAIEHSETPRNIVCEIGASTFDLCGAFSAYRRSLSICKISRMAERVNYFSGSDSGESSRQTYNNVGSPRIWGSARNVRDSFSRPSGAWHFG